MWQLPMAVAVVLVGLSLAAAQADALSLAAGGRTEYVIVLSREAGWSEKWAAEDKQIDAKLAARLTPLLLAKSPAMTHGC